jgi:hypothetical protein
MHLIQKTFSSAFIVLAISWLPSHLYAQTACPNPIPSGCHLLEYLDCCNLISTCNPVVPGQSGEACIALYACSGGTLYCTSCCSFA